MANIDFKDLARVAFMHARRLVADICPGGDMMGREYTCAGVSGGKGTSFRYNVDNGLWADFATDQKGNDLIALMAASYGCSQLEAAKRIAEIIHYKIDDGKPSKIPSAVSSPTYQSEISIEKPFNLTAVPDDVKDPVFNHFKHGMPVSSWLYKGRSGERLFWIARYDTGAGKEFIPFSWCANQLKIINRAWSFRPIYGLEFLDVNPNAAILIVEGEKAAQAARKFISPKAYIVISWSGGSKAFDKTDWAPIKGRRVLIWPDNDLKVVKTVAEEKLYNLTMGELKPLSEQPGVKAALGIAKILAPHCEVKYFSPYEIPIVGEIDGFDAADAYEAGWTWNGFLEKVKPIVRVFTPPPAELETHHREIATEWVNGSEFDVWASAKLKLNGSGKPVINVDSIYRLLNFHDLLKGKIWFDDFHMKIFTNWQTSYRVEWSDMDDLELCRILQSELGIEKMTHLSVRDGVRLYANKNRKNEPRDWISTLKWDGVDRLTEFFPKAFKCEDSNYSKKASINFWVAMVARVFEPGIKFDNMVILEGEQGQKKSWALRAIAGEWFGESTEHITSKDFAMCLHGKMIIEIPELASFGAAEVEAVKKMITTQSDRFRPPYGAAMIDFKRSSVFVGTTNRDDYLRDPTGSRRFWPISVGEIDLDYIKSVREQCFAEALVKFREGFEYWTMPAQETAYQHRLRVVSDEYEAVAEHWLTTAMRDQENITVTQLAEQIGIELNKLDKKMQYRLYSVLKAVGFERKFLRIDGTPKWVWNRKKLQE